jgi:hypothetical protein
VHVIVHELFARHAELGFRCVIVKHDII